ncbi:hypothetical protein XI03_01745 [Bradyrhizobium sp. CCBAU 65884]|nr:hypothetical protein [Bradyrhizobium sp. CCBAU 65884]
MFAVCIIAIGLAGSVLMIIASYGVLISECETIPPVAPVRVRRPRTSANLPQRPRSHIANWIGRGMAARTRARPYAAEMSLLCDHVRLPFVTQKDSDRVSVAYKIM